MKFMLQLLDNPFWALVGKEINQILRNRQFSSETALLSCLYSSGENLAITLKYLLAICIWLLFNQIKETTMGGTYIC
ncbi:hypothetical protein BMF77_04533 [Dolichospermum sp. UHCC 0315A]|nr:hypothetical protein BMF77_04533 [Dolichospermum sp. UHCC 0315A]